MKGKIGCKNARNLDYFGLLPNGYLSLCCNDFGMDYIVGDLKKQEWEEIIKGKELNKIKSA